MVIVIMMNEKKMGGEERVVLWFFFCEINLKFVVLYESFGILLIGIFIVLFRYHIREQWCPFYLLALTKELAHYTTQGVHFEMPSSEAISTHRHYETQIILVLYGMHSRTQLHIIISFAKIEIYDGQTMRRRM